MTDVWSRRAEAFRDSPTHREGPDLDLLVEWCEPGHDVKVLDVATGGGHVARRLREAGCTVITVDPAPGMEPDVVAPAEALPFEDGSFDVVACRIAAHHFSDIRKAVAEMARVSARLLVIEDNVFRGEHVEEAERLRDPSHVRCYSEAEWRELVTTAGGLDSCDSISSRFILIPARVCPVPECSSRARRVRSISSASDNTTPRDLGLRPSWMSSLRCASRSRK